MTEYWEDGHHLAWSDGSNRLQRKFATVTMTLTFKWLYGSARPRDRS